MPSSCGPVHGSREEGACPTHTGHTSREVVSQAGVLGVVMGDAFTN